MRPKRLILLTLSLAVAVSIPISASAQDGTHYLGMIPENAIMAGHAHVSELLDIDRLERLMNSWGPVLGDRTDSLIAEMRDEYNSSLAPFATNVQSCVVYAASMENNAPVTVCEGTFGAPGYAPPQLSEVEVINESVMVTGSTRTDVTSRLGAPPANAASVGGIAIDPSLLAHFVAVVPSELMSSMGGIPQPLTMVQTIELRIAADDTQLGGISLEVRVGTASADSAQAILALYQMMLAEIPMTPEELETIGLSVSDIAGWAQVEGTSVVLRPSSEGFATLTALAIPAFVQYTEAAQAAPQGGSFPATMPHQ